MAKRNDKNVAVKKEPASLFCATCREWVVTLEKHNMFYAVDGVHQVVQAWQCPGCRKVAA